MTKVTNIPGRLHSVEQGNIVAGANEIYDDTKGKKQNVINSETDAELLRLEQTKQDNLTFDNAPTENSNNPVKSGGVYAADLALQQAIEAILLLIPSAATSLNQLADKAFVNSSISTATATFRGTYNVVTDLHLAVDATHAQIETALASVIATADNNDYCFVQTPVSSSSQDIQKTSRYKFNGSAWVFEYDLNTSGFTSAQWAAINSGITAALVAKLGDLPTATELSTDLQALSTAIGSEETRAKGVEQDLSTAIQGILGLIPSDATSSNKLADKTYVTNLINAITALIPAEATDQNQLADKAYVLAQILAATPAFKGQFTTLAALEAVSSPKAGDIGIVRTTDSDGFAVFTFYQYLNDLWNVYYTLAHHLQNKPATTGTTGDYPYNGMGRIVIPKNMVGGVNTLTQDAFEDGEGNPLTNTVFVIQTDFVLGENITVPSNCVLEFDGGSISGAYTITGDGTCIICSEVKCFGTEVLFGGSWRGWFNVAWFGLVSNDQTFDNAPIIQKAFRTFEHVYIPTGDFYCTTTIEASRHTGTPNGSRKLSVICDANLHYITQNTSNRFIQVGSLGGKFEFNGFIWGPNGNIDNDTEKSIGISFYDCQWCDVKVCMVSAFHTNVEFLGGGFGNAYNNYEICAIGGAKVQVHFNTRVKDISYETQDGWVNSNEFRFNTIYCWGNQTMPETSILFKGEGGNAGFNDNVIYKLVIEYDTSGSSPDAPIKIYNAHDIYIKNVRFELTPAKYPYVKLYGRCSNIFVEPSYYEHDLENYRMMDAVPGSVYKQDRFGGYSFELKPFRNITRVGTNYICPYAYNSSLTHSIATTSPAYHPLYFAVFKAQLAAMRPFNVKASGNVTWYICYYDENHQALNRNDYQDYKPVTSSVSIRNGAVGPGWSTDSSYQLTILIPKDLPNTVKYVGLGCVLQVGGMIDSDFTFRFDCSMWNFDRFLDLSLIEDKYKNVNYGGFRLPYSQSGTRAQRPGSNFAEVGATYFDTDLGKPIYCKNISGDTVTWVDATGATV